MNTTRAGYRYKSIKEIKGYDKRRVSRKMG
jgi:hypothetical protein